MSSSTSLPLIRMEKYKFLPSLAPSSSDIVLHNFLKNIGYMIHPTHLSQTRLCQSLVFRKPRMLNGHLNIWTKATSWKLKYYYIFFSTVFD